MGTVVSFHIDPGDGTTGEAQAAIVSACALLHQMDDVFSTWKPESPISRLRSGRHLPEDAPPEIALVIELCEQGRALSQGWFDPWAMPGGFDPTGLVKGWATEQALEVLRRAGTKVAIVNGGGDIAVLGRPDDARSWRIGIRHPWRPEALACLLEVDTAVATSGCYERGPHLINPKDGTMLSRTASASVVGPSLALCDALATALVVAGEEGPELARSFADYEAYLISADGEEYATEGIVFAPEGAI